MSRERKIRIRAKDLELVASLNDSSTANAVWDALPIIGRAQTWGDEIYFSVPIKVEKAVDAVETVEKGAVAFWPPGNALCLFCGPTPVSQGDEIRPASAVNVVGKIDNAETTLAKIEDGDKVEVIHE